MIINCSACSICIGPDYLEFEPPTKVGNYMLCSYCYEKLIKYGKTYLFSRHYQHLYLYPSGKVLDQFKHKPIPA